MHKAVLFAAALILVSYTSAPGQTSVGFVSDATWEAFAMNPDGSQGAALGPPQFPSWAVHGASFPGASWMWRPGVDASSPADLQGAYFSKQFNLQGIPLAGHIAVAADDFAAVIINGSVVGSTGSITDIGAAAAAQGSTRSLDLTPYLVSGVNTITVKAQNGPASFTGGQCNPCTFGTNLAGVLFGGSLTYDPATPALRSSWGQVKARYR